MEVQVIAGQVGKHRDFELCAFQARELQTVRRNLESRVATTGFERVGEKPLKCRGFGRRVPRGPRLGADFRDDGPHHRRRRSEAGQEPVHEIGGRRLAVGAGDTHDVHVGCRISRDSRRENTRGLTWPGGLNPGNAVSGRRALADDGDSAARDGIVHEQVTVGRLPRDGDEDKSLLYVSGVDGHTFDRNVTRAFDGLKWDEAEKLGEAHRASRSSFIHWTAPKRAVVVDDRFHSLNPCRLSSIRPTNL